jgi:hypothetical protein
MNARKWRYLGYGTWLVVKANYGYVTRNSQAPIPDAPHGPNGAIVVACYQGSKLNSRVDDFLCRSIASYESVPALRDQPRIRLQPGIDHG